jgi:protein SCO1
MLSEIVSINRFASKERNMSDLQQESTPETVYPTSGTNKKWIMLAVGTLVGIVLGLILITWLIGEPILGGPEFHGTELRSPEPAANFTLTTADGVQVSLNQFKGKVVLLYFGYTFCPDVCPATMVELKQAVEALGDQADKVQVIMISVDPLRDTPEFLQEYVTHFHESFIGVTGSEEELLGVTTQYGVFYEKHEGTAVSGYLIDHTASVIVVDREGHLRMIYSFDTPSENIASDLRYLVRR